MNNLLMGDDVTERLKQPVEKIPNRYSDYLSASRMRNVRMASGSGGRDNRKQLEQGFSLYFNGANSELSTLDHRGSGGGAGARVARTQWTRHGAQHKSRVIAPRNTKTSEDRPKWESASKFGFLTDRGDRMVVRANDYYSDDFEQSTDIDYSNKEQKEEEEEEEESESIAEQLEQLTMRDVRCLRESVALGMRARGDNHWEEEEEEEVEVESESERLRDIIDRVLKMSERQRQRLLKSLEKLETVLEKDERSTEEAHRRVRISMRIEENWGHESRVGLTEVEFRDAERRPIAVDRIECGAAGGGSAGRLGNLSNQKKDTAKEKNMWSTEANLCGGDRPVIIDFHLATRSADDVKSVAIWNFNKSIDTLSIGVKKVSLWAEGDRCLGAAAVDKSLGNAAFNPPTIIDLSTEAREDSSSGDECLMERFELARAESARKTSAKFGRRSELKEARDELKELVEEVEGEESEKEKFWSSLSLFNRSHAGRLSLDRTGDILDQYIDSMRSARGDRESSDSFVIPELPRGSVLTINILSTWGDRHYVGLTGLELFSSGGDPVPVRAISADPPDINVLPGYGDDPRVVANLLDGVNRTRDDTHMWLAPFTPGGRHVVRVEFRAPAELALLRVWNYSKSRIHSSRGARDVEILLDRAPIFRGEISRQAAADGQGEVILFTADDAILDRVGQHDREFAGAAAALDDPGRPELELELIDSLVNRPPTARETGAAPAPRPFTCSRPPAREAAQSRDAALVTLQLADSWGDPRFLGLTGIELLDEARQPIEIAPGTRVSSALESAAGAPEFLLDGHNLTDDERHMWLALRPAADQDQDRAVTLTVDLAARTRIGFIRFWNYNKSLEDSYRGVKILHMWINDERISPDEGYFLRRGPGHTQYDFMQEICIRDYSNVSDVLANYQHLPCGFVYQFNIFSAWNDLYYVGLNGIEFYDHLGHSLSIGSHQVYAFPDSVNYLTPKNQRNQSNLDVRTPDKLVDGINNTYDPKHMWLAPILPGCLNKIFFVFNHPIAISMIKIWNYSKSPARGVKDFSILVDDLLIHNGILPAATSATVSRGILPNMNETISPTNLHKTVLFDKKNPILLASEKFHIIEHGFASNGQDVILINNNDITAKHCANQKHRPTTSVKHRTQIK